VINVLLNIGVYLQASKRDEVTAVYGCDQATTRATPSRAVINDGVAPFFVGRLRPPVTRYSSLISLEVLVRSSMRMYLNSIFMAGALLVAAVKALPSDSTRPDTCAKAVSSGKIDWGITVLIMLR
jgi:hypothetical protein